jgi:hypothetical protein
MTDDFETLVRLNVAIGDAEHRGDRGFLDGALAPQLGFRRATAAVVDRAKYLEGVAPSEPRDTDIQSIQIHGDRAIVTCIVTLHRAKEARLNRRPRSAAPR